MVEDSSCDSETEENAESDSSGDAGNQIVNGQGAITAYEKQRLQRIKENKARLDALGLRNLASSFLRAGGEQREEKESGKRKGRRKSVEEDEDYTPIEGEHAESSSDEDTDKEDHSPRRGSASKGKQSSQGAKKSKKNLPAEKFVSDSEMDDEIALQQAIALSLSMESGHSGGGPSADNFGVTGTKEGHKVQESSAKRRNKKMVQRISRVQMTEDEMIAYFFSFDEAGKGTMTVRDLQRMAATHDFAWTEKELFDMIYCFDSDGDGKLSLEDFRTIVSRCNLLRGAENVEAS